MWSSHFEAKWCPNQSLWYRRKSRSRISNKQSESFHPIQFSTRRAAQQYGQYSTGNIPQYIDNSLADRGWIQQSCDLVHVDMCGKFAKPSFDGSVYFVKSGENYAGFVFDGPSGPPQQPLRILNVMKNSFNLFTSLEKTFNKVYGF